MLDSSEPKKIKLSEQEIRQEFIEEEKGAESPLETSNKTTQLNFLDRLKQQKSNGKNRKSNSVVNVGKKKQSVSTKLVKIGLSIARDTPSVFQKIPIVSQQNVQTFNSIEVRSKWICYCFQAFCKSQTKN